MGAIAIARAGSIHVPMEDDRGQRDGREAGAQTPLEAGHPGPPDLRLDLDVAASAWLMIFEADGIVAIQFALVAKDESSAAAAAAAATTTAFFVVVTIIAKSLPRATLPSGPGVPSLCFFRARRKSRSHVEPVRTMAVIKRSVFLAPCMPSLCMRRNKALHVGS